MKCTIRQAVIHLFAVLSIMTVAEAQTMENETLQNSPEEQKISVMKRASLASSPGPSEYFTGSVEVAMLFTAPAPARTTGARVTFAPGARTAWHSHPFGQTLIVTDGTGSVQQWGGQIEEMKQGDVVWIPPGVKHWHGASPNTTVTHLAIQEQVDGSAATWMEQVSEEEYRQDRQQQ